MRRSPCATAGGSIDAYAAAVGRWLVTRDGFDFLAYYLSDFDYASHVHGPDGRGGRRARQADAASRPARRGRRADAFLERYAVVLVSDHGQTTVEHRATRGAVRVTRDEVIVTASNRAGQVYLRRTRAWTLRRSPRLDGSRRPT